MIFDVDIGWFDLKINAKETFVHSMEMHREKFPLIAVDDSRSSGFVIVCESIESGKEIFG